MRSLQRQPGNDGMRVIDDKIAATDKEFAGLLQDARNLINRNDLSSASAALDHVLAIQPDNAGALQLLGVVRQKQGDDREAEDLYRRSLAIQPAEPHVHFNLGTLFLRQARFDDAAAAFAEAVRQKPNYAEAHLVLGYACRAKGDYPAAEKAYRQALRVQPNFLAARQGLANVLSDLDRHGEAERELRLALVMGARDPRMAASLQLDLGVALKRQRRHAEALRQFDVAQTIAPDIPTVDYNRANVLQDMSRFEDAVTCYRRAIARNPLDMNAHQDLNHLLYRLGRDDQFLISLDEAARLHPESGALPLLKGGLLFGSERHDEAIEVLERAARLMPDFAAPHDLLGQIQARRGRFEDAIRAHERATELEPENASLWTSMAGTLLRTGDPQRARDATERALITAPADQNALALWGLALRKLEDPREEYLNDYENLVQIYDLPPPEGYDSMEAFNRDLNAYLDSMHIDGREPLEQTLRNGTQTHDNLFGRGHDIVERLRSRIDEAVFAYMASMKEDQNHPLFRRRTRQMRYSGSWSARLSDCGFHTNHVHPHGWISSCYYVALPDAVADEQGKQGWIKFGEPAFDLGFDAAIRRTLQPVPGRLVLFPSYMWHGTIPFRSQQTRTTIAFDAIPA